MFIDYVCLVYFEVVCLFSLFLDSCIWRPAAGSRFASLRFGSAPARPVLGVRTCSGFGRLYVNSLSLSLSLSLTMYINVCVCIYIYIYIYRERERYTYVCINIYMYIYRERER